MIDEIRDIIFWILLFIFVLFLLPAEPSPAPNVYKTWRLSDEYIGWVWYANDTPVYFDRAVEWKPEEIKGGES